MRTVFALHKTCQARHPPRAGERLTAVRQTPVATHPYMPISPGTAAVSARPSEEDCNASISGDSLSPFGLPAALLGHATWHRRTVQTLSRAWRAACYLEAQSKACMVTNSSSPHTTELESGDRGRQKPNTEVSSVTCNRHTPRPRCYQGRLTHSTNLAPAASLQRHDVPTAAWPYTLTRISPARALAPDRLAARSTS